MFVRYSNFDIEARDIIRVGSSSILIFLWAKRRMSPSIQFYYDCCGHNPITRVGSLSTLDRSRLPDVMAIVQRAVCGLLDTKAYFDVRQKNLDSFDYLPTT